MLTCFPWVLIFVFAIFPFEKVFIVQDSVSIVNRAELDFINTGFVSSSSEAHQYLCCYGRKDLI